MAYDAIFACVRAFSRALILLIVACVIAACSEGGGDDPTGRTWQLVDLEGAEPVAGTIPDLAIADDVVSGNAGCNTYSGPANVDVDQGSMTLGPDIISTMMACEDPVNDQERRFLDALVRVTTYEMADDTLTLLDADGIVLATFE